MGETQETWDPHRFLMRVLKKGELSTKNIKYASGQSYLVSFTIYQGWKYLLGGSGFGAIDKRCEKASDAPWSLGEDGGKLCIRTKGKRKPIAEVVDKSCEHMAKLIASARADLPYLRALQFVLWTQHEVYYSGYKPTKKLHDEEVIEQIRRRYEGTEDFQMDLSVEGRKFNILRDNRPVMRVYRRADADFIVHAFGDIFSVLGRIDRLVTRVNRYLDRTNGTG